MGLTKTETATVFSNTTRSVFYCSHSPHIIWDLQDTTSPWVFAAVALPPAVLLNALIHVIIAVKRRRELKRTSNILLSSFGRYRSFSRKFVCTVICCGRTVGFLSITGWPLQFACWTLLRYCPRSFSRFVRFSIWQWWHGKGTWPFENWLTTKWWWLKALWKSWR